MADVPVLSGKDRSERAQRALLEIERIHAECLEKLSAIKQRQLRLFRSVLERIDREKAQELLSSIKGGLDQPKRQ